MSHPAFEIVLLLRVGLVSQFVDQLLPFVDNIRCIELVPFEKDLKGIAVGVGLEE